MKSLYLRSCLALALAAGLAACGGGNDNLLLTGNVIGLTKDGLVMQNNGGQQTVAVTAGASGFIFGDRIGTETDYDVTIKTQPTGAKCEVKGGKGRSGMYNVTNTIFVFCETNAFNLGGSITGLSSATGLILANGADTLTVPAGATSFTMPTKVADGAPYGVTVLAQPTGRSCTVADGVGLMGSADLATVKVACN